MTKQLLRVIQALENSISSVGIEDTIVKLYNDSKSENQNMADFILELVCERYKTDKSGLKLDNKTFKQQRATLILTHLLYYFAHLTQSQIGYMVGRSKASINRYLSDLHKLNEKVAKDNDLLKEINHLETKIKEYKNKI
tara:strand:+ start:1340 stop:1756 length:417 start_codon:yes stop_codon:yes gene_type:complete